MKIDCRTFVLMYFAAQTDDLRYPHLGFVAHMEDHWAIDDHACYYLTGQHEPEQPQWPPVIEPGWSELYRGVNFYQDERWSLQ